MTKKELKKRFKEYPDVVTLPQMRAMMGGIGDSTARKLLWEGHIQSFLIHSTYYIPKQCVIDYLLSDHYEQYRPKLKYVIPEITDKEQEGDEE